MKKLLKTFSILFLISFYSCGNYTDPEPEADIVTTFRPGKGTGMAIGVVDFGNTKPVFDQGWFRIKPENAEKRGKLLVGYKNDKQLNILWKMRALTNPKLDIENKNRFVYLFTIELNEGNYDIFDFTFIKNNGFTYSTVSNCGDFELPFSIKKNKISYLGEIQVDQLALIKKAGGKPFIISDNFETNLEMFKQKYKTLYLKEVENQTISGDEYNTGIFAFN